MALSEESSRKRKIHTKSRQGCRNCKLRRVKCDEKKPNCRKCTSFGVACDYDSNTSDLQFSAVGSFQVDIPRRPDTPPHTPPSAVDQIINSMMNAPLYLHVDEGTQGLDVCYIDKPHLDLLRKFHNRTVKTIGTKETMHIYQDVLTREAARHSFVLHAVLRFTLMHDRVLYDPIGTKASAAEAFHGYHAAALFGKKLTGNPLAEDEKDAMWATAAILGASAFAAIEATSAEEAWPLKTPEFPDLDWLKMSDGKKEVWRLANPLRPESAFRPAIETENSRIAIDSPTQPRDPDLDCLFPYVTKLYNLDSPRSVDTMTKDPYHTAATIVEKLVPIECTHSTILWFMSFIGHMEPEYRQLVEVKDPAALLLLSWWYAKMLPYDSWWMKRRVSLECRAICLYLDQVLPEGDEIRRLLEFPKGVCGLRKAKAWGPDDLPIHNHSASWH